ncbi:HD-GYP domain-containing protein [Desulfoprunum benzoelyticum]|uniref:HD-GYP domain-containing protein (C-di-GMP phosphodiesterase class II) n=1 Tax=Desulfoprunum benzoelyticum TaxID=1506996 RepID=A0A840UWU1_9BACT|nr:HD-GYP domain-containing protein [Desulfoprunum benzoelyticum]MBB5347158.1 HD-GYP domain-containing protein (c-di-GMP phosphodiesterase class II) [Desulfoprunum benzoelyticum]MBM9531373.1 HD-GYP domain-containing protein [Desulfoprunum benzoelyticum]
MARSRPQTLQTFVYRTLAIRLAVMAALVAVATTAAVYVIEGRNLRNLVAKEVQADVRSITLRTMEIVNEGEGDQRAAFRRALDEWMAANLGRQSGEFVYVRFHGAATNDREERRDDGYARIGPVLAFIGAHPLAGAEITQKTRIVMIAGAMHIYTVLPVTYRAERVGVTQAVFAPAAAVQAGISRDLRRSAVITILVVVVTSALLYPVILLLARKLVTFSRNLLQANLESLAILAGAIAKRDSDTDIHNFRVTLYAVRLAEQLKLPHQDIQTLIKGAFLHDVGKIGVRDSILLKPGSLDEQEFSEMKDHVRHGLDIVKGAMWLNDAAQIVGSHHEKFDGSGYPEGLAGQAIPLPARIFAVADVFDALTSRRPYKEPLSCEASVALVAEGRGRHFDPEVVDAFLSIGGDLHRRYAGRDDQGLRDELKTVITRYFSTGEILLD